MEINDILKSFSEKIDIEIVPSDDGVYMFDVDGIIVTFHVLQEIDTIILTGDIGEPPPERLENLYKTMLEAQYLFKSTFGATISLNSENNHFYLCKALPQKILDGDSLYAETEQFVNTLELWVKLVANYRDAVSKGEVTDEATPELGSNGFIRV
ncbi:MAG: type III secretion system chaperone [Victivallales bacterium]|nr:type III secretion system chaperone [Victivallales bacterium]